MKNKTTAGILAILLGGVGVHKFYLGQIGMGFLYLIFCFTFIPSIIALIEGIILLTSDEKSFNLKYNQSHRSAHNQTDAHISDELEKLHNLKTKGILTDEEYAARKKMLLG